MFSVGLNIWTCCKVSSMMPWSNVIRTRLLFPSFDSKLSSFLHWVLPFGGTYQIWGLHCHLKKYYTACCLLAEPFRNKRCANVTLGIFTYDAVILWEVPEVSDALKWSYEFLHWVLPFKGCITSKQCINIDLNDIRNGYCYLAVCIFRKR